MTDLISTRLSRQLEEVEAIQAMYPGEGEFHMTEEEKGAIEILRDRPDCELSSLPISVSFTVKVVDTSLGGRPVRASFHFPHSYPDKESARVTVECGGSVSKLQHEVINLGAQRAADEALGQEAVLHVLQRVQDIAWELETTTIEHKPKQRLVEDSSSGRSPKALNLETLILERRLIWFHHIKSTQKRKLIVQWSAELRVGGLCKPGFPGVLVVEGENADVEEYVRRLQGLRWQAIQARGHETETVPAGEDPARRRRFPLGVTELPESGLSDLAAQCRQVDLEALFLTALKICK